MNFHTKQEQWGLSALRAGQTLPLKEMDAMLQKKIRFFFKELEIVDLFIVFVYLFFFLWVLSASTRPATSFSWEDRGEAFWVNLCEKEQVFFLLKGQKDQNEGQAIFWRHMEKKIDVYASGCCSRLFIKQAKHREGTSTLEPFKHFEGGRLKKNGPG